MVILQIEPTTRCNLSCKYCGHEGVPVRDLQLDTLKEIIKRHRNDGVEWVRLHGWGEPFLTEPREGTLTRAAQLKLICKTINLQGIKLSIVTNGIDDYPYGSISNYCQELLFSIDTFDPEKFAEIKGGGPMADNLDVALENLEKMHARNMKNANPYRRVGINQVRFPEITPYDVQEVAEYCRDRGLVHYINPLQNWTGTDAKDNVTCEWGRTMLYYDANGNLHPCCRRKGDQWIGCDNTTCGKCNGARTLGYTGQADYGKKTSY